MISAGAGAVVTGALPPSTASVATAVVPTGVANRGLIGLAEDEPASSAMMARDGEGMAGRLVAACSLFIGAAVAGARRGETDEEEDVEDLFTEPVCPEGVMLAAVVEVKDRVRGERRSDGGRVGGASGTGAVVADVGTNGGGWVLIAGPLLVVMGWLVPEEGPAADGDAVGGVGRGTPASCRRLSCATRCSLASSPATVSTPDSVSVETPELPERALMALLFSLLLCACFDRYSTTEMSVYALRQTWVRSLLSFRRLRVVCVCVCVWLSMSESNASCTAREQRKGLLANNTDTVFATRQRKGGREGERERVL